MLVLMLAGVVHRVDLGHAAGQVAEEPRSDLGVDTFAGGQEPGDFVHALAETGAIFSQDGGVGVEGSCRENVYLTQDIHMHMVFYLQCVKSVRFKRRGLYAGVDQPRYVLKRTGTRQISPEKATYRSSEPSGGSGDVSPSSPGCPPFPV